MEQNPTPAPTSLPTPGETLFGSIASRSEPGARWYAFHTLPRAEGAAEAHLLRQGFEVFVPRVLVTRRHARKLETVKAAFFPRYGFVRLDLGRHRWRSVNGTTGIASLVMGRDLPRAVPHGVVEDLFELVGPDGHVDLDWGFRPGDEVRLKAGPFTGQVGILHSLDAKGRVEMLLSLIAGQVRMKVAREMLEPVR